MNSKLLVSKKVPIPSHALAIRGRYKSTTDICFCGFIEISLILVIDKIIGN